MKNLLLIIAVISLIACTITNEKSDPLAKASKEAKNGLIQIHLEGSPSDIGYQHGYLLADEIDTAIQCVSYGFAHETHKNWAFYRNATFVEKLRIIDVIK